MDQTSAVARCRVLGQMCGCLTILGCMPWSTKQFVHAGEQSKGGGMIGGIRVRYWGAKV